MGAADQNIIGSFRWYDIFVKIGERPLDNTTEACLAHPGSTDEVWFNVISLGEIENAARGGWPIRFYSTTLESYFKLLGRIINGSLRR